MSSTPGRKAGEPNQGARAKVEALKQRIERLSPDKRARLRTFLQEHGSFSTIETTARDDYPTFQFRSTDADLVNAVRTVLDPDGTEKRYEGVGVVALAGPEAAFLRAWVEA